MDWCHYCGRFHHVNPVFSLLLVLIIGIVDIPHSSLFAQNDPLLPVEQLVALAEWQDDNGWRGVDVYEMNKEHYYPMGVAAFARGYASLYRITGDSIYLQKVIEAVDLLKDLEDLNDECNRPCWGLPFSWYDRASHAPYAITTIQVGLAMLEAYDITREPAYLAYARQIGYWLVVENGYYLDEDGGICFWYAPATRFKIRVHNVNAMAAGFLAWLGVASDDAVMSAYAQLSFTYLKKQQRADGSWVYNEDAQQKFPEYHTGYILEGLSLYLLHTSPDTSDVALLRRGADYYIDQQITPEGTALLFSKSFSQTISLEELSDYTFLAPATLPLSQQSLSEEPARLWGQAWAVGSLALVAQVADDPVYLEHAGRVYTWMYENLSLPNGAFAFLPDDQSIYIRHEGHVLYGVGLLTETRSMQLYDVYLPLLVN
jgi:hypothetical protein